MKLSDRTALVTGASGGIGREIALRLARDGARVVVHFGGGAERAGAVVEEIEAAGGESVAISADVSNVAEIERLFAKAKIAFGSLDIFVNNAGVGAGGTAITDTDEDTFDRVFAINAKGAFFALREASRVLDDGGRVVNVSSSTTYFPTEGLSVYSASKAVMKTFTEIAAKEIGPRGITVNTVAPGPTVPGMFEWSGDDVRQAAAASSPFNRLGEPKDIADVVAFLASEDARWITGQHILVNGGATI